MDIKSHSKAMVLISEDGELTEIKEFHGDSLVWVSEGEHPHGEHMKVMKYKMEGGEQPHGEHVIIMKKGGGENGNWHAKEGVDEDHMEIEKNVYVISGDESEEEIKKIMKKHGEEGDVEIIVIKKKVCKDHDANHDEDVDVDHDEDEDHNVEVEVVKKKRNEK